MGVTPAAGSESREGSSSSPRLENWLVEVDRLMQAEAWEAAHAQILAMQQQVYMQKQVRGS
jgi:hypothetical protein